jgi:TonB family protein
MKCSSCGASNADDARFCNMCGVAVAATGAGSALAAGVGPEGVSADTVRTDPPPAAAAPGPAGSVWAQHDDPAGGSSQLDLSSLNLRAVGVRSQTSALAVLLGLVLLLVGSGAGATYLLLRLGADEAEPEAEASEREPASIPEGADAPAALVGQPEIEHAAGDDAAEEPSSAPRPARRPARRPSSSSGSGTSSGGGGTGASTGGGGGSSSGGGGAGASTGGAPGGGASAGSGSTPEGGSASGGGASSEGDTGSDGDGTSQSGSSTGGSGTREPDWDAMEEELPPDRDVEMDMYASRVRRVIREFYLRRSELCFDHASRNAREAIRGTVVVAFTIPDDGEVERSRVTRNTTGYEDLGACIARQVGDWRLPPPPEGEAPLDMSVPFSR